MAKRMDKTRPYGYIFYAEGQPKHDFHKPLYTQDGKEYNFIHQQVNVPKPRRTDLHLEQYPIVQLKRLIEYHGGTYTTKAETVEWLQNLLCRIETD